MRKASQTLIVGFGLSLVTQAVLALGFGRVNSSTSLGQPLNFAVGLNQAADEFVDAECVSADVTVGDDVKLPRERIRVSIEGKPDSPERLLRVTSPAQIHEPFITVTLHVGCPPQLSREFTTFIDPPTLQLAQSTDEAPSTPEPAAPKVAAAAAQPEPKPAVLPAAPPSPPAAQASNPPKAPPKRIARAGGTPTPAAAIARDTPASNPRPQAAVMQRTRPVAAASSGPRLQLETVDPRVLAASAPQPASAPVVVAAADAERTIAAVAAERAASAVAAAEAAAAAASQAVARERERVQQLEEALAKAKAEAQKTSESLAALKAQVQQSQSTGALARTGVLAWILGALLAVLAIAVGVMMRQRGRERQAQWWAETASARSETTAAAAPSTRSPEPVTSTDEPSIEERARALAESLDAPPTRNPLLSPETLPAVAEPKRSVTVEELIDLEQQADFFVVLGQDEAAIDLLMNHLRGTGGISPLPYLKLLEIYRRRNEHEPYERIRERFNRRFNAYAPEWHADVSNARTLEQYPAVMERIQALWTDPQLAMDELETQLFRREEGETFDLPAYGELLFLYATARDRLERVDEPAPSIDIMLPMGDEAGPTITAVPTISLDPQPSVERPLRIDVDVTAPPPRQHRDSRHDDGEFSFGTGYGDRLRPR